MSTQPDQIRHDIQRTEAELSGDINTLTDRVNPQRVARRRVEALRGAVESATEKVMGSSGHPARHSAGDQLHHAAESMKHSAGSAPHAVIQRAEGSPLAAGLIAFGAGVLVSSLLPRSRPEQHMADRVRHTAQEHSGQFRQQVGGAGQQLTEHLREPAHDAMQSLRSTAGDAASRVRDESRWAGRDMKQQTQHIVR